MAPQKASSRAQNDATNLLVRGQSTDSLLKKLKVSTHRASVAPICSHNSCTNLTDTARTAGTRCRPLHFERRPDSTFLSSAHTPQRQRSQSIGGMLHCRRPQTVSSRCSIYRRRSASEYAALLPPSAWVPSHSRFTLRRLAGHPSILPHGALQSQIRSQ